MLCKNCGRTSQNENANFCDYCGASFRTSANGGFYDATHRDEAAKVQEKPAVINVIGERPIMMKEWLGMLSLFFIPYAGPLIFFIMLFVWAFDNKDKGKTKKEWARAMLIFIAGLAVLCGIIFIGFMAIVFSDFGP